MNTREADSRIFVFDTTNAVLWGEEIAQQEGIPVEVVPAPAGSDATCDLALACRVRNADDLVAVLRREGVSFARWQPGA